MRRTRPPMAAIRTIGGGRLAAPGKAWLLGVGLACVAGLAVAEDGGEPVGPEDRIHDAGAVRMELREQEAALTRLVTIVEALRSVAPQREAVDALLGDSAEAARIRAALAAIRTDSRATAVTAPQPGRLNAPRRAWLPDAADLEYVQSAPPRVMLRHHSGRRVALVPGAPQLVGGDRIVLDAVEVARDGRPSTVALTVNGQSLELGTR